MINRRDILKGLGAAAGLSFLPAFSKADHTQLSKTGHSHKAAKPFTYCLNMATVRGHNLGFIKELEVASKAGFEGVEIWIDTLQAYLDKGGTLKDAKRRIDDLGIVVENCIGFAPWIISDE